MNKPLSIVLVALVLLNTIGYYGIFVALQHSNDVSLSRRLDVDDYDLSQTVTLKLPLAIPYITGSEEFERVEGKFEYEGEFYQLVKQKHSNDTLTVVCIRDHRAKTIHNALAEFVKGFTDKAGDHSHGKLKVNFIKEYLRGAFSLASSSAGWNMEIYHKDLCTKISSSLSIPLASPPEV